MKRRIFCLTILLLVLALCLTSCNKENSQMALDQRKVTANYILNKIENPGPDQIGGDWAVFGIKTSGIDVDDEYYENYYDNLRAALKVNKGQLTKDKYTTYARIAIALKSIGKDPTDVDGYNLMKYLDNSEVVISQGINGPIYALIAANYCGYKLDNESLYVEEIRSVLKDGSQFKGDHAEVDYNAMALQAISYYSNLEDFDDIVTASIDRLVKFQQEDGSFGNCEATAQFIMALCSLKIDPNDKRIVKNGHNAIDGIMTYVSEDGFLHESKGEKINQMSTEQALLALNAYGYYKDGKLLFGQEKK